MKCFPIWFLPFQGVLAHSFACQPYCMVKDHVGVNLVGLGWPREQVRFAVGADGLGDHTGSHKFSGELAGGMLDCTAVSVNVDSGVFGVLIGSGVAEPAGNPVNASGEMVDASVERQGFVVEGNLVEVVVFASAARTFPIVSQSNRGLLLGFSEVIKPKLRCHVIECCLLPGEGLAEQSV